MLSFVDFFAFSSSLNSVTTGASSSFWFLPPLPFPFGDLDASPRCFVFADGLLDLPVLLAFPLFAFGSSAVGADCSSLTLNKGADSIEILF